MKHPAGPPFGKSLAQRNIARQQQLVAAYAGALRQAESLVAAGRFDEALRVLAPLLGTGQARPAELTYLAWRGKAEQLLAAGHVVQSAGILARLVTSRPRDARAWWLLGHAQFRQGHNGAAANAFGRAAALDPDHAGVHADLSAALEAQGDVAGSRRALRRALKLRPDQQEWRSRLQRLTRPGRT